MKITAKNAATRRVEVVETIREFVEVRFASDFPVAVRLRKGRFASRSHALIPLETDTHVARSRVACRAPFAIGWR